LTLRQTAAYTAAMPRMQLSLMLIVSLVPVGSAAGLGRDQQTTKPPSQSRTRDVYVGVVDGSGKAVTGLTTADFVVREDGVAREVIKVGPATDELTIAMLVDDSQSATNAIPFIRDALTGFFKKLDGKAEIAMSTVGERPTPVVEYTSSTVELEKSVGRIFARPGGGAYLLEGIVEVSRGLEKREAKRPVIVALTIEDGPEFSNLYYQNVLDALKKSGAALHVIAIGSPASSSTDEMKNRNIVIADGTSLTGGRRDQVLADSGISSRLAQLADELINQYVVTYSRPETLIPPEKVEVSVTKPGLTARASRRAGR
jgi:VWFA-related protein